MVNIQNEIDKENKKSSINLTKRKNEPKFYVPAWFHKFYNEKVIKSGQVKFVPPSYNNRSHVIDYNDLPKQPLVDISKNDKIYKSLPITPPKYNKPIDMLHNTNSTKAFTNLISNTKQSFKMPVLVPNQVMTSRPNGKLSKSKGKVKTSINVLKTEEGETTDVKLNDITNSSVSNENIKNEENVPIECNFEDLEFAKLTHHSAYSDYQPTKLKFGKSHPYTVVESRSLMTMEPPEIEYKFKIPSGVFEKSVLSNVQIEAMVYACQKHESYLTDGMRAGFLIGDGAGVGKGRTVAGIIYENYFHGRKKAIWVSVSNDLKEDAVRDMSDVGSEIGVQIQVKSLNKMTYAKIDSKENSYFSEGVLFITYSCLIGSCSRKDKKFFRSRLDQIIDWFGLDYDGVVIFDESHRAKNLTGALVTKTGLVVLEMQNRLTQARVVYASATGATEPMHMAYMVRLGLWGPNDPFKTFKEFGGMLKKHGVAAMELIAVEMKMKGMYMARQLSFKGIKFEIDEIAVENADINGHNFKQVYNQCSDLWCEIFRELNKALDRNRFSDAIQMIFITQYWGSHQRFFKYLCMSGKVARCVAIVNRELERGKCVVLGLQSTGEARTMAVMDEQQFEELADFVSSAKGVVKNLVENFFPTKLNAARLEGKIKRTNPMKRSGLQLDDESDMESADDLVGETRFPSKKKSTSNKHKDEDEDADERIQKMLLDKIGVLDDVFPINVLDQLIQQLGGPGRVAEMTGRRGRMVARHGKIAYETRKEVSNDVDQVNIIEKDRFNQGEKLIAIISDAASTGISLHSDRRFKNQRQRVHITLELPWSADKAIQQFGRTHRSNQVVPPHYLFLISDLAGERRFAATVAKRLESLGALTHGDRRTADTTDLSQFNHDNVFGQQAVNQLIPSIIESKTLDVPFPDKCLAKFEDSAQIFEDKARDAIVSVDLAVIKKNMSVSRFLNRLLGMNLDVQNGLFQWFLDIIDHQMEVAKSKNAFDHGIRDVIRENNQFYLEGTVTMRLDNNDILIQKVKYVNMGVPWQVVMDRYNEDPIRNQFCTSIRGRTKILAMAEYQPNGEYRLVTIQFPEKTISSRSLSSMYTKMDIHKAKTLWNFIYCETETECLHVIDTGNCTKKQCSFGKRTTFNYIITGSVFLAWKLICAVHPKLKMEIIRVELHDGTKLIGALVHSGYIKYFMKILKKSCIQVN